MVVDITWVLQQCWACEMSTKVV